MKAKVGSAEAGPTTHRDPEFRVVIADDHRLLLEALKAVLAPVGEFTVVGVTDDAERIVPLVRDLQPHLLVLDYSMPGLDPWSLISRLRRLQPGLAVVVLTGSDDPGLARAALMQGARGFVHKSAEPEHLVSTLRAVVFGEGSAVIAADLPRAGAEYGLTAREQDVLTGIWRGLSSNEIGSELNISRATVKHHVRQIYAKLDVHSRLEAVRVLLEGAIFGPAG
jgi:DNA-binding NarL/FixJ family response regulator